MVSLLFIYCFLLSSVLLSLLQWKKFFSKGFDFSSTSNLLKGGVNRINTMVNSGKGNRKLMFYMILVMVVGFVLLYKILSKWS